MCGITGLIGRRIESSSFDRMVDRLAHRGPDDRGTWYSEKYPTALGHRRLSILDLSQNGHQPMQAPQLGLVIVHNGEVYNFKEIRSKLEGLGHRFRSDSDTEVLLYAYHEWGEKMLDHLRGMFSFAIWDENSGELFAVRDRLGIKPFYYVSSGDYLAFASEIKSLLEMDQFAPTPDVSALYDFLTYMYIPAPKTNYREIKKLPAGHYLKCDSSGRMRIHKFWDVECGTDRPGSKEQTERLENLIGESVAYRMISDVPVGYFLSGGIDSSTVVAFAAEHSNLPLNTFTIGFDRAEFDERDYAREFADQYGTDHYERELTVDVNNDIRERIIDHFDEPNGDSSIYPVFYVTEFASSMYKVAVSGSGGDEVFNGYNWFNIFEHNLNNSIRRIIAGSGFHHQLQSLHVNLAGRPRRHFFKEEIDMYVHIKGGFTRLEKQNLLKGDFAKQFADYDDYWYFREYWKPELDPLSRVQYLDLKTYLPENILTIMDRMSMMHSLEVRVPLLDHKIVEYAFSLSYSERPFGKQLLQDAAGTRLSKDVTTRKKKGFSSPLHLWYPAGDKKDLPAGMVCDEKEFYKFSSFKQNHLLVLNRYFKL